jgi:hypothetical protein
MRGWQFSVVFHFIFWKSQPAGMFEEHWMPAKPLAKTTDLKGGQLIMSYHPPMTPNKSHQKAGVMVRAVSLMLEQLASPWQGDFHLK